MKKIKLLNLLAFLPLAFTACHNRAATTVASDKDTTVVHTPQIPDSANFKATIQGQPVNLYILKNKKGAEAAITNYGGCMVSLLVPDNKGTLTDVILGYDSVK